MRKHNSVDRLYILRRLFAVDTNKSDRNSKTNLNKSNVIRFSEIESNQNKAA